MGWRNYYKKVAAAILIAVAAILATIVAIHYLYPAEATFYSKRISPGQTYVAWDGNPAPSHYYFHAIYYQMYINSSVVYGSGTQETSWTCPEYVYGHEGNSSYTVGYAVAWTDGLLRT
jgi:hypothetical protein